MPKPAAAAILLLLAAAAAAQAQAPEAAPTARPDHLAPFDGTWRGPATIVERGGGTRTLIQTERVGPLLDGAVRVIEGKAYAPDGTPAGFNALGIVSAAPGGGWEFRTYAQGRTGTFAIALTPGGFEWVMPAGAAGAVRYTARIADGRWHEEGWFEQGGRRLAKVFDMTLVRVGPGGWPAAGAVPPR
jgi:hypothetical protein